MLRRTLLTALAALVLASPAMAQHSPQGDDGARAERSERGGRGGGGERSGVFATERSERMPRQIQIPRDQWAPQEERREREVPLSSILRDLRAKYGGQHLDAQKMGGTYRISWITGDGRRLVIEVDASSGRTLSVRG